MMPGPRPPYRVCSLLLLVLLLAAPAAANLQAAVKAAVKEASLSEALISVSVRDVESGAELVSIHSDRPMIPASNFKLLTTGAALDVLGPDFEFTTRLLRDGDRLIVVGDGDPAFGDPELLELMSIDIGVFLGYWTDAVRAGGLEPVSEIVVDDRVFDRQFVHPGWPADQLNRRYCAEVSGLSFHQNVVHFFPRPSGGTRPDLSVHAPVFPGLNLRNRGTCDRGPDDRSNAWFARRNETNDLTMYGNVKVPYRVPIAVTVHDVPTLFGALLAGRLEQDGIQVGAVRLAHADDPVAPGIAVGPAIRTPISTIVTRCNRDSENLYAEALLKRLAHHETGRAGSWAEGRAILRHVVRKRIGPEATDTIASDDGSGLSRANRIAAGAMTAWLDSMHRDESIGVIFLQSLAVAGESGTLRKRFRDANLDGIEIRGKSGYINQVSCLSGYVTAPGAAPRSYSILINELASPGSVARAKLLQEKIVLLAAENMVPAGVTLGSD